jgi:integrase
LDDASTIDFVRIEWPSGWCELSPIRRPAKWSRSLSTNTMLLEAPYILQNPPDRIGTRKGRSPPFSHASTPARPAKAASDRLALRLMYDLALRCGEVVSLDIADVDLSAGTLAVKGKGQGTNQLLTLPEPTKQALADWLAARENEPGLLFTNFDRAKKGKRLTQVDLWVMVRDLRKRCRIKVRPHGLRHTAITEACMLAQANRYGLEEVLDFSRHSRRSIAVLMVTATGIGMCRGS